MNGIAERIEDGADFVVHLFWKMYCVECRDLQIFGKGAGHIDADATRLGIEMKMPGPRHAALHANQMTFARDTVAHFHGADMGADVADDTGKFVADHHGHGNGLLRPLIPLPDVKVRAADTSLGDLDQNIIRSDLRHRFVTQDKTFSTFSL